MKAPSYSSASPGGAKGRRGIPAWCGKDRPRAGGAGAGSFVSVWQRRAVRPPCYTYIYWGGTTLVEAKLLNRNIIGVDINDIALARCREKTDFEYDGADGKVSIRKGDARHLDFIPDESIDLICTHPPYADIIQYSEDIERDLSHLSVKDFLEEMKTVAAESYRVLKKNKFCAILIGDTRKKDVWFLCPLK